MEGNKKILAVDRVFEKKSLFSIISLKLCNTKAVVRGKYTRLREPNQIVEWKVLLYDEAPCGKKNRLKKVRERHTETPRSIRK